MDLCTSWRTLAFSSRVFRWVFWVGSVLSLPLPLMTGSSPANITWTPVWRWMNWRQKVCGQTAWSRRRCITASHLLKFWNYQVGVNLFCLNFGGLRSVYRKLITDGNKKTQYRCHCSDIFSIIIYCLNSFYLFFFKSHQGYSNSIIIVKKIRLSLSPVFLQLTSRRLEH